MDAAPYSFQNNENGQFPVQNSKETVLSILMMLIVNKTKLNPRSQNRTSKTCASTGFANPILQPEIAPSLIYY